MKLYAYQPKGHGEYSFFTIAESEEEAKKAVDKYIAETLTENATVKYEARGWGTDYYRLTVLKAGQVIENDNS